MTKYPIHHVRGGSYSKINMDRDAVKRLMPQLCHAQNLCMRCGSKLHWSQSCDADEDVFGNRLEEPPRRHQDYASGSGANRRASTGGNVQCFKCERFGHYANACPVQTTRGRAFPSVSFRASSGVQVRCFKCNRLGHVATACPSRNPGRAGSGGRVFSGGSSHSGSEEEECSDDRGSDDSCE
jgi:hypothetical protein